MDERLHFPATAAAGYDDHVGQYTGKLVPRLLEIARLKPGQTVLEVATGTGIAAFAAADVVGKSGGIVATDLSPHMLDRARERLASFQNSSFSVEDGQALSFPDQSFDAVICNMGLMYFPDPGKGVKEFPPCSSKGWSGDRLRLPCIGGGISAVIRSRIRRRRYANRSEESVESTAWGTLHEVRCASCRPICERGLSRDRIGSILGLADHAVA